MRRAGGTVLLPVVVVAAVWGVMQTGWYPHHQITDYGVYADYGDGIVHGHAVPYRDFRPEYPPAALPVFIVPALLERFDYDRVFQVLMALCDMGAVAAVALLAGRRAAVIAAVAPLALGSVVLSRFDFWPAALAALGLAALVRGRSTTSALLVGTAFAAKLWPVVLAPLAVVWLARTRGVRAAAQWSLAAVATAAAWFLPFVALSPAGVGRSFHTQLARPLQLESLAGSVLIAVHNLAGTTLHLTSSYGSQNLTGTGTHAAAVVTTIVEALALVAVWFAFARGPADEERLLVYAAAAVAAFIAFGKVFSPQFLIWLIPLVPLVRGRRAPVALSLFGTALVLTQLWFPRHYWDLALRFASPYSWFLLVRDLAVVALLATLVWPRSEHERLGEHRSRLEALHRVRTQVE
jgi:glycosyl transferase family 87